MTEPDYIGDAAKLRASTLDEIKRLILDRSQRETPRLDLIQQRVETIERVQGEHVAKNDHQHTVISEKVRDVRSALYGNGNAGIAERVRNLEDLATSIRGWGRWLKVGVAGLILKAIWDLITQARL